MFFIGTTTLGRHAGTSHVRISAIDTYPSPVLTRLLAHY